MKQKIKYPRHRTSTCTCPPKPKKNKIAHSATPNTLVTSPKGRPTYAHSAARKKKSHYIYAGNASHSTTPTPISTYSKRIKKGPKNSLNISKNKLKTTQFTIQKSHNSPSTAYNPQSPTKRKTIGEFMENLTNSITMSLTKFKAWLKKEAKATSRPVNFTSICFWTWTFSSWDSSLNSELKPLPKTDPRGNQKAGEWSSNQINYIIQSHNITIKNKKSPDLQESTLLIQGVLVHKDSSLTVCDNK